MRSLRRSLTLYFLALVAAGVGAVAVFADQVIGRTLAAKEEAGVEAIRLRADERASQAREKLDDELLNHARVLGRVFQAQYRQMYQTEARKFPVMMVPTPLVGVGAAGPLPAAVWTVGALPPARGSRSGFLVHSLGRAYFTHRQLADKYLRQTDGDDTPPRYVQVNSGWGAVWRAAELGAFTFPHDPARLKSDGLYDYEFDDQPLPTGQAGRRVVFRTTLAYLAGGPRGSDRDRRGPGGPPAAPETPPESTPDPLISIYIHCAIPSAELSAQLSTIEANAGAERAALADQTRRDRGRFRAWVVGVGLATFASIVIGGPLLIRRGLGPVDKLSDAVSRVSEKDFRLAVVPDDLSRELIPIHDRLTQTLDALRRAFAREKQAVADISHELRTPLAGLLASLDVALRKPRSAEQYKATLEECRQIGKELSRLVERILTLAALDAGRAQVRAETLDAAEVATGCATVVRPLAAAHGLTFDVDAEPGVEVVTDPDKLRDVLQNLLHNAVEYNRPGGSVRLAVRAEGSAAVFEVADTGIGMPPEVREHIFERFYRADASRHATGAHAGLGLSVVKEYVDRLGGTIAVTSTPDVGSTFRVTLPAAAPADRDGTTAPAARPQREPAPAGR